MLRPVFVALVYLLSAAPVLAQAAVTYRVSIPEPEHRWLQVEAVFPDLGSEPVHLRMSRASPGRYALHEFAKNVYDVRIVGRAGQPVVVNRPNPHQWDVTGHDGTVRVTYKVYGDRVDGTYLGVDPTHAHINMPATLMWARGLHERPVEIRFEQPPGVQWRVATQLHTTSVPLSFTAPNLQYLMDSPAEFSNFAIQSFKVGPLTFHLALHHNGAAKDTGRLAGDIEKVVREELAIYGELPRFDTGSYTFLADYLPHASGDGMEHRNSTVITGTGTLQNEQDRENLLATAAHEFFHSWNVERIRPKSLEPFDFEAANMSGELWLAEGFTSYYETLVMRRTGLADLGDTMKAFAALVNATTLSPGRRLRSAEDMSRLAPFVDAARSVDRTNWENTYISYYTWGAAIGLGLDLTLRDRTDGHVTLDHFMRAMWEQYGKPGGRLEGYVDRPYTIDDARERLAEVIGGDRAFADEFFNRYIQGHEVVDYGRLLARAGLVLRKRHPGRASIGDLRLESTTLGVRLVAPARFGSPAYKAGLDQDDELVSLDGEAITSSEHLDTTLRRRKPGARVTVVFVRRGRRVSAPLTLEEDPVQELVPVETTGRELTAAERGFREAWLGSMAATERVPPR